MKNNSTEKKTKTFIYENPVDKLLYHSIEYISDTIYNFKITPNMITFLGLITGLLSAYYLYEKQIIISLILWIVCYYLDLLDGYIARKYDQGSKFGGWFDHISDILKFIAIGIVLYKHKQYYVIIILTIVFIITLFNTSCKTKYLNRDTNKTDSLYLLKNMCPDKNYVKFTHYFGEGTGALLYVILIIAFYYNDLQ